MRLPAALAALFILFSPFAAGAANSPQLEALCKGSTGDPTGSATFEQTGEASIMDTFLKKKVLCPSACFDVVITLSVESKKLKIVTTATDKCVNPKTDAAKIKNVFSPLDKPNDKRNCNAGKGLPSLIATTKPIDSATAFVGKMAGFSIPDVLTRVMTVGPKSRCDESITKVISAFTSNGNNGLDVGFNQMAGLSQPTQAPVPEQTAPEATPVSSNPTETPKPDIAKPAEVPTGDQALAQVLTDKYGVPADQAKALVESDADKIKAMMEKSMTNDTAGAQAIAKELKLNDDVMTKIAEMQPAKQMTAEEAAAVYQQQQAGRQTTFEQPEPSTQSNAGLPTQCGTDGLAGNIMYAESRCAQINSNPLSSVQGPYHFLCGTWTAYAQSTGNGQYSDCAYRNDPNISTQVMNAKMDQFASKYGSQCSEAGLSITSCQYAIHVFGEGGYRQMFNAYQNNPNDSAYSLCGSALTNAACTNNSSIFKNGGTVAGVFGELDRRLGGNGQVIPNINPSASPFTGFTSGTGYNMQSGSPFTSANPFYYSSSGYGSPTGYSYPTGGTAQYGYAPAYRPTGGSPLTSLFTGIFSGLFGSGTQPTPTQTMPAQQVTYTQTQAQNQAVASIIAQPQNAYVGSSIVLSWSSVGMKTDQQCVTSMLSKTGTTTVATTNEGSKVITANAAGILRFIMSCTAQNGSTITQVANVAVQ